MADHQEAIGDAAFVCVDKINNETVSQFNSISLFKESIQQKKEIQTFYKNEVISNRLQSKSPPRCKASTTIPSKRGPKQDFISIMGDSEFARNALKEKRHSKTANGFEMTFQTVKSPIHRIPPQNEDHSIPLVGVSNLHDLFNM